MMNIYEEIKVLLVRNGKSMSKVLQKMKDEGHNVPFPSNLSKMFISGSIRFKLVQELLDYLGYEFKIVDALITNFHLPQALAQCVFGCCNTGNMLNCYRRKVLWNKSNRTLKK